MREQGLNPHNRPQAKAITWEEAQQRRSGGEPPQKREPTFIEQAIRDWALKIIQREKEICETDKQLPPAQHLEFDARKGQLTRLFNSIKYNTELSGTMKAVRTIWDHHFGRGLQGPA
jgi:hypothetical protein